MNKQRAWSALAFTAFTCASVSAAHAGTPVLPCGGPSGLLGQLDRPTVGDSTCVVPQGMTVIEAGASAGNLYGSPGGRIDTLPNLELRFGLPDDSEFVWLPPDFQYQSVDAAPGIAPATMRGFGATTVGVKHLVGYTESWQWTDEALMTLPSGDSTFGSHGVGGALNAIVSYGTGPLGVSLMVGVTSQTEPTAAGGQRFQSFNPDLVVTWQSSSRLQFYAEMYAQSHSGYGLGWGTDADGGVQYLLTPDFEVDLEEGVRIQGSLGGFSNYTGVGLGLLL
ncbi:MAG: transporter [Proteobacteria bacterium]|nr:transporter [Pseudomonadota bacterium]